MSKYKAIIFDMDGTIVDSERLWKEVNKVYLNSHNVYEEQLIEKIYEEIRGLSDHKIPGIIKKFVQINESEEELIKNLSSLANKFLKEKKLSFIKGFKEFFEKVKKLNIPVAIATNATISGLRETSEALFLHEFFGEHMYSMECVGRVCKPSPDVYIHAAKQINIDPKYCIAIEDSAFGVTAAVNAGMYCIAIDSAKIRNKLQHANLIIDDYSEINLNDFF